MTIKTKEKSIEMIRAYFEENAEIFNQCIEELDWYNGYLGDDRYYEMDQINDIYYDVEAEEILRRAFYGHDADTWHTDARGEKEYGAFNPNRNYFTFNGYGNLISSDYKDYSVFLDHYVIEKMSEHRAYIDTIENDKNLTALFNELEEEAAEK